MNSTTNSKPINEILASDFALIMDAIRRLEEGTHSLVGEDKVSAADLFQRLKLALKDHVNFEENNLPALVEFLGYENNRAKELSNQLKKEHQHLMNLLDAAEHELFLAHPEPFRAVIKSVKIALHDHLQIEHDVPFEIWGSTLEEDAFKRMAKRAKDGFLGLEYRIGDR